jgi:ribosomal protein L11 methyltransferase
MPKSTGAGGPVAVVHELVFSLAVPGLATEASPEDAADDWLEWLSDELMAMGALCVGVEDALANDPSLEHPHFGEPGAPTSMQAWPLNQLRVLLPVDQSAEDWWQAAQRDCPVLAGCPVDIRALADEDWVGQSQRAFTPIEVRDQIWIGPSWHERPEAYRQPPKMGLSIDPGMAFGTGGHATTRLCLETIVDMARQRPLGQVLDYGCGSGILGLACAKLGASGVIGVDIDPVAVRVAQANAALNLDARELGLTHWQTAGDPLQGQFDLVVANILAQPLKLLAGLLLSHRRPGGWLVLSGVLSRQIVELQEAYAAVDPTAQLLVFGEDEGWACLGLMGAMGVTGR